MRTTVTTTRSNPVQVARRRAGGAQVIQGRSYVMLSHDEVKELIVALQELIDEDCPRAEKMTENDQRP